MLPPRINLVGVCLYGFNVFSTRRIPTAKLEAVESEGTNVILVFCSKTFMETLRTHNCFLYLKKRWFVKTEGELLNFLCIYVTLMETFSLHCRTSMPIVTKIFMLEYVDRVQKKLFLTVPVLHREGVSCTPRLCFVTPLVISKSNQKPSPLTCLLLDICKHFGNSPLVLHNLTTSYLRRVIFI